MKKEEVKDSCYALIGTINDAGCWTGINWILGVNEHYPKTEKITLVLSSRGGSLPAAESLISAIESSKVPVHTVAVGEVCSAALLILMAGKHRCAARSALLMSHQFSCGAANQKEHDLEAFSRRMSLTSENMLYLYRKYTGLSTSVIKKELLSPTDRWMTPQEAKRFNIIDEVYRKGMGPIQNLTSPLV